MYDLYLCFGVYIIMKIIVYLLMTEFDRPVVTAIYGTLKSID